jgi:MFS family permease
VPALTDAWALDDSGRSWLTMSVQVGFVAGALTSALLNLSDRLPTRHLFATSAFLAALATASIPLLAGGLQVTLLLRFLTGFFLAGVYPVGMKIMATWTKADRGLAIGLLVGALTLGSAAPHLLAAVGGLNDWQLVLYLAALLAAGGGLIAVLFVREGPHRLLSPPFNWRYAGELVRNREMVLANLGYLGHMWELYAVWAWLPVFFLASFQLAGVGQMWASLAAFAAIGVGGAGCVIAGLLADRVGRTTVATGSLLISGLCAVTIGLFYGASPLWLVTIGLLWGFAVVADSAQFSASITELCRTEYTGTALTLQTCLGFLLTLATIRLIPLLEQWLGWQWAFAPLAIGPLIGIWAMQSLRRLPAARRLAGGNG